LTRFISPPNTTTPDGEAAQFAAVSQAVSTPAGNSGQTAAAAVTSELVPAATVPQVLQNLGSVVGSVWPFSLIYNTVNDFLLYGLPTPTNNWIGLSTTWYSAILKQTLQAYFGVGIGNFGWSIGQQTFQGIGTTAGAGGAWYPTPQFAGLHLGGISGVSAVSGDTGSGAVLASTGEAGKVGMLSVPANWAEPTSEATLVSAVTKETPVQPGAMAPSGESNALLRGMPTGVVGRRTAGYGYTNKYGFKHSVLTRPPSAG
jgi:hypothetical protein